MAELKLFINTSNNTLLAGQSSTQSVDPSSLPLFFGDTLQLTIYLLELPAGYSAADPASSTLETVDIAGLQLFLYLTHGEIDGDIYAQQIAFTPDLVNNCFTGNLALNTAALDTLLGAATSAQCWLKIGYVQGGLQTTVFSKTVTIGVGLPAEALVVPPGQTPLSAEVANATYLTQAPVAGRPIYLESANGKIIALLAVDNPDGTASLQASPMN